MAEFFSDYGLFLLQAVTIVIAIIATMAAIFALSAKAKLKGGDGHIEVTYINDELDAYKAVLQESILDKYELKKLEKERKENEKAEHKAQEQKAKKAQKKGSTPEENDHDESSAEKQRLFLIDFDGDMRATQGDSLAKEVTAILQIATPQDEILIRVESPGGVVHGYGLAASQLARIRDQGIHLTVAVDKVAASGGYMMACLADKIIAAPFAILGSIGVLAQVPNFNRLLKKHDIDYDIFTAGEYKRTVTVFGKQTDKGRKKFIEELEETHELFKQHVAEFRPQVDIHKVATGEHWYGRQAIEQNLVDQLITSEDYLLKKSVTADIYQVSYELKKPLIERLSEELQGSLVKLLDRVAHRIHEKHFL